MTRRLYWGAPYLDVPVLPLYAQSLAVVGPVVSAYGFGQLLFCVWTVAKVRAIG